METKKSGKKLHYAYIVMIGMFLLQLPTCLIFNTMGLFYSPIVDDIGCTLTQMGLQTTIMTFTMILTTPLLAKFFNSLDTRITLTATIVVEALCWGLRAMFPSIWVIWVTSVFLGMVAMMLITISLPIVVNHWFDKKAGMWIGIIAAAQGLGGIIFNSAGGFIIEGLGWRACYWVWFVITLGVGLPSTLLLIRNRPAEKGLFPVGYEEKQSEDVSKLVSYGIDARAAKRTPTFIFIALMVALMVAGNTFNFYYNSYITSTGIAISLAGICASIVSAGTLVGKFGIGAISDKNLLWGGIVSAIPAIIAFAFIRWIVGPTYVMFLVGSFLFGLNYAAPNLFGPILTKEIFGTRDFDRIWPTAGLIMQCGSCIAGYAWGAIIEGTSYETGLVCCMAVYALDFVLFLLAYSKRNKMRALWTTGK